MQTNLIFTNSKYGSLLAVLEKIKQNKSNNKNIIIVPDKFSLNTEKRVMEYLGISSTFNITVTSFDKISDEYCRTLNLTYLSKNGGVSLIQKILLDNINSLSVFSKSCKYSGFSEDVFNNIMLLKSCNISPQDIKNSVDNLDVFSKVKINEIAFIYEKYEEYLNERFYDSANKLTILEKQIKLDDKFKNTDFYYALFDDYTPQALNVISALSQKASSQTFGLQKSERTNKWNFFDDIATQKIVALFGENAIVQNYTEYFTLSQSIIEKFIGTKNKRIAPLESDMSFWQANSVQEEIDFVAKNIVKGIKEGQRYKNYSIGVGNLEKLMPEIEYIFDKYNIPYFVDMQTSLSEMVISKYIFSIFNAIQNNYQQSLIIDLLHSPFVCYENEQKFAFENYLIAHNIDYDKIFEKFTDVNSENEYLEKMRLYICDILNIFNKNEEATVFDYCQTILDFIDDYQLDSLLLNYCQKLEDMNLSIESKQNEQSIEYLKKLLIELQSIFNTTHIEQMQFLDILKAGVDSILVANAPNSVDEVFIGDSNASIFDKNNNFYFINCTENTFPIFQNDCGLILDSEINSMNVAIKIEPTINQINKKSVFNIYNNCLLYNNCINFSYSLNSLQKEEQKPSSFLLDIMNLFAEPTKIDINSPAHFHSINNYLNELSNDRIKLNNITPYCTTQNLIKYIKQNLICSTNDSTILQKIYGTLMESLSPDNKQLIDELLKIESLSTKQNLCDMAKILENKKSLSVSQLETYFTCPYRHFAKHIMRLKDKPNGIFKPLDIGNFLHRIAELFFKNLIDKNEYYCVDSILDDEINKIIKSVEEEENFVVFFKYKKENLLILGLENEAKRMCKALNEQAKHSGFHAKFTEYSFKISSKELGLEGIDLEFKGKIDRIDEYNNYFRIIDYKTGADKYDIKNLFYGKKIQLHLYAFILQKLLDKKAFGVFYSPIKDDYTDKVTQETYRLDGVMRDDVMVAIVQDDTLGLEKQRSIFLPLIIKKSSLEKNGEFEFDSRWSHTISNEYFDAELEYSTKLINCALQEIIKGNIAPSPFKDNQKCACDYCAYQVACAFNPQKDKYREYNNKVDYNNTFVEIKNGINTKSKDSDL